jgi:hypothetical protein
MIEIKNKNNTTIGIYTEGQFYKLETFNSVPKLKPALFEDFAKKTVFDPEYRTQKEWLQNAFQFFETRINKKDSFTIDHFKEWANNQGQELASDLSNWREILNTNIQEQEKEMIKDYNEYLDKIGGKPVNNYYK